MIKETADTNAGINGIFWFLLTAVDGCEKSTRLF